MLFSNTIARSTARAMICRTNLYQLPSQPRVATLSTQTSQAMAKLQAALEEYRLTQ